MGRGLRGVGRQPVRVLHAGHHHATGRAGATGRRARRRRRRAGAAGPPVPVHRVADDRGGRPAGVRRRRRRREPEHSVGPCGRAASARPRGRGAPGRARGWRTPGGRARCGRVAVAASPTTRPPPMPWWPCPTAAADGSSVRRWPRPGDWPARSRGATRPWRCATRCRCPPGDWDLTLRTTWVEPGLPRARRLVVRARRRAGIPLANGGAFGGKRHSPVAGEARRLADENGRPVRVLWSREDVVRSGPNGLPSRPGATVDGIRGAAGGAHPGVARPRPVGAGGRPAAPRARGGGGRRGRPTCLG